MPNDATVPYEENPNHMIIWLDAGIGDPERYQNLKKAFATTNDPKNETPQKLNDGDYQEILDVLAPQPILFEGVRFMLAACTNIDSCLYYFEENQDKRIFFITSGALGRHAVPIIIEKFQKIFTDPHTNAPYCSIYVFCHNIELNIDWALDYRAYIQTFNFDADVLSRMVRDIADYFLIESKHLLDEEPPNNAAAYHRLSWAYKLFERYEKLEGASMRKPLKEINELLEDVEEDLKSSNDSDE